MQVDRFELARIFDVSADTVRNWQRAGCPSTAPTKDERRRLYVPSLVHRWLVNRAIENAW